MTKFITSYKNNKDIIYANSKYDVQKILVKKYKISINNLYKLIIQSEQSLINNDFKYL